MNDKNSQLKQEARAWAQRQAADARNQTMGYIAPILLAGATILGLKAVFEPSKQEYAGRNYAAEAIERAFTKSQGGSVEHTAGFAPTKKIFENLVTSVAAQEGFDFCAEVTWKSGTFPVQFLDLVGDHWEEEYRDPAIGRTVEVTYADSTGSMAGGQIQYWSEDCDLVTNRLRSEVNNAFEGGNTSEPSRGIQSALEALIGPAVLRKTGPLQLRP